MGDGRLGWCQPEAERGRLRGAHPHRQVDQGRRKQTLRIGISWRQVEGLHLIRLLRLVGLGIAGGFAAAVGQIGAHLKGGGGSRTLSPDAVGCAWLRVACGRVVGAASSGWGGSDAGGMSTW